MYRTSFALETYLYPPTPSLLDPPKTDLKFEAWKGRYGVSYESAEEEAARLLAFESNLRELSQHSVWKSDSNPGYTLGLNRFSDMTWCVCLRALFDRFGFRCMDRRPRYGVAVAI